MVGYYSVDLAEKITRGLTENALSCRFNGDTIPIGYKINEDWKFKIDTETAPYVLEAFKKYEEDITMQEIADDLNAK